MASWHYASQGNRFGPMSLEELLQAARAGRFLPTDYVFEEGTANWVTAGTVPGLFAGAVPSAPGPVGAAGQAYPYAYPYPYSPPRQGTGKATASLVLGIIGLLAWIIPLFGAPVTITGLVLGLIGRRSTARGMAVAGIVMCVIGLALTVFNGVVGCYLAVTGQHALVNRFMR